ncbi:MAG: LysR family transcriptional regulator [Lachnospiraceae bacterium]|nr:LysR family transcriptional regulator [Lachnospiraceae bacterium]
MNQSLSWYRVFHAVAKNGNISKAAKELFISQPAISKSIQKLEESLNTKLFIRGSRGVTLTEEGKILYAHTSLAFDTIEQGERQILKRKEDGAGQLRIGASTTLCKYILLPILRNFIQSHPHIKVSIHCQSTFETVRLLEEGKIDIGLTGKTSIPSSMNYVAHDYYQDIFVSTRSYLNELGGGRENLLASCNLMLLDEDNISRLYINQYFQLHNIEVKQVLEISTMDLLIEFAKIGLGVACVIREFVERELNDGTLVEIKIPEPIKKRSIGFAYKKQGINQNSVDTFLQSIHNSLIR